MPQSTGSQPPSSASPADSDSRPAPEHVQPFERLEHGIDPRPWIALLVVLGALGAAAGRWEWLRWPLGVLLFLVVLRAAGFVLAAKALGKDPEAGEKPAEVRRTDGPA